jgi:CDP-4-dehydro-6-deoxyglucose reductase
MHQLVSVSRAARLAGVSRADLQGKIRRGELATFEGQIDVEDLLRLYPQVSLEQDETLDRLAQIKASAGPKLRQLDGGLPDPGVLLSRFNEVSRVLVETKTGLNHAERLIEDILDELKRARGLEGAVQRRVLDDLIGRIERARSEEVTGPDPRAQFFSEDSMLRLFEAHVHVANTGHDFFVHGSESILQAALRAGLYLSYGCLHGNCGLCKSRVLSGEARKLKDHEYVLGEQERADGYILSCSYTAVTDLELDAVEALSVGDIPQQEIRAGVKQLRALADELLLLRVQTPATQTFRFMSGQHATLALENHAAATLPVASCPCSSQLLDFIVRRHPEDAFSQTVFEHVKPGQMVTLSGPSGGCTLQVDDPEPALFIAVQDGMAPVKSLVEHAIAIDMIERMELIWGVSGERSRWLDGMCRSWADALDNFGYQPIAGTESDKILSAVEAVGLPLGESRIYLAGPRGVVTGLRERLGERGVDTQRLSLDVID